MGNSHIGKTKSIQESLAQSTEDTAAPASDPGEDLFQQQDLSQTTFGGPPPDLYGGDPFGSGPYGGYGGGTPPGAGGLNLQLVQHPESKSKPEDELVAVIVTICDGGSYDEMFRAVPQDAGEGYRVAVWQTNSGSVKTILDALKGGERKDKLQTLCENIEAVLPNSVVFNWECCGGCSERGFTSGTSQATLELIEHVVTRGSMVMCSDFSLKALIADWQPDLLGPNPFVNIGGFNSGFKLHFDPKVLAECPSAQLQKVGELCVDSGTADVKAMSDTLAYTVDAGKASTPAYALEVLTVATNMPGVDIEAACAGNICSAGGAQGSAGHVLLTYPTGGTILTSSGHWIELVRLDVSMEALLKVAQTSYGGEYAQQMQEDMGSCANAAERSSKMQEYACKFVQQSAPCQYSKSGM